MDQTIVFHDFFVISQLLKTGKIARFKKHYGSGANCTVQQGVQMDNLVHKDNTGWNSETLCDQSITTHIFKLH